MPPPLPRSSQQQRNDHDREDSDEDGDAEQEDMEEEAVLLDDELRSQFPMAFGAPRRAAPPRRLPLLPCRAH
jgi:hypothetical protein